MRNYLPPLQYSPLYRGADKSLARPTSRCILFDGENSSFDTSLVMYINNTNIPPFMIINRIYENQNLLSLKLVSFLVGLRTYPHPCSGLGTMIFCFLISSKSRFYICLFIDSTNNGVK